MIAPHEVSDALPVGLFCQPTCVDYTSRLQGAQMAPTFLSTLLSITIHLSALPVEIDHGVYIQMGHVPRLAHVHTVQVIMEATVRVPHHA